MPKTIEERATARCIKYGGKGLKLDYYTVVSCIEQEDRIKKTNPDLPKALRKLEARLCVMGQQTTIERKAALENF